MMHNYVGNNATQKISFEAVILGTHKKYEGCSISFAFTFKITVLTEQNEIFCIDKEFFNVLHFTFF